MKVFMCIKKKSLIFYKYPLKYFYLRVVLDIKLKEIISDLFE